MKKIIVALMACLLIVTSSSAKTLKLDDLYETVCKVPNGNKMSVGAPLMALARLFASKEEARELRPFRSLSVVYLDDCEEQVKTKWMNKIVNGHFDDYTLLVSTKTDDEFSQVWVQEKKDKIVRMIVMHQDDESFYLTRIKGKFNLKELMDDPEFYTKVIH